MDCKKDKIGNFERGYSQSNHRKVTDFGLLQDFKRMIMIFGSRVNLWDNYGFFYKKQKTDLHSKKIGLCFNCTH